MKRQNHASNKKSRRRSAEGAISHLRSVIENNLFIDKQLSNSAANQLKAISKRHSISLDYDLNYLICRKCSNSLIPGSSSRVRINKGMFRITCTKCGNIRRKPISRSEKND